MTLSPDARVRAAIRWVERTRREVGTEPFDDHRDLWTVALVDALAAARRDAAALREACEPFNPGEGLLIHSKGGRPQTNAPLWCVGADVEGRSRWVTVEDFLRVRAALAATPPAAPLPAEDAGRETGGER